MIIRSYKDLTVWKKSMDLSYHIFVLTKKFPREELFGLAAQMRRAAFSIPSNIAEGYTRHTTAEYIQFLRIAFASGAELETQLLLADRTKLVSQKDFETTISLLSEIMKMLNVLIRKLKLST